MGKNALKRITKDKYSAEVVGAANDLLEAGDEKFFTQEDLETMAAIGVKSKIMKELKYIPSSDPDEEPEDEVEEEETEEEIEENETDEDGNTTPETDEEPEDEVEEEIKKTSGKGSVDPADEIIANMLIDGATGDEMVQAILKEEAITDEKKAQATVNKHIKYLEQKRKGVTIFYKIIKD